VEDSNPAVLAEQMDATAFIAHPYRIPTIGWPSDIQSWTLADLQAFYHRNYAPNNCTLVIAGDVDPAAAFALAEKFFAAIPRRDAPPPVKTQEPEQLGERRLVIERPGQNPLLQMSWHGISASDPRAPALNILQTILVGGDASRLHRTLVEEQKLAVDIGGGWPEGFDPSLFSIEATLPEGAPVAPLEKALDEQIALLLRSGITDAELSRAKNLVATGFWDGLSTIDGKARMLGEYVVIHSDFHLLFDAPAAYDHVTREQVLAVAHDVFVAAHRTVGVLLPKAAPDESAGGKP
jgi:zinc protease